MRKCVITRQSQQDRLNLVAFATVDRDRWRTWIADAHSDDGKLRAHKKLIAFVELESAPIWVPCNVGLGPTFIH